MGASARLPVALKKVPTSELDCMKCGACCVAPYDQESWVDILREDVDRLTKSERRRLVARRRPTPALGSEPLLRFKTKVNRQGHVVCKALSGLVGLNCKCSVYERRPTICQDFSPGSGLCRDARKEAGLE